MLVFAFAALWILFLAGLTIWTANPITLNRDHLLDAGKSGAVLVATVLDARAQTVRVDEIISWTAREADIAVGRELVIEGGGPDELRDGETIILPLIIVGRERRPAVAVSTSGRDTYPATPEVIAQVKDLLKVE